MRLGIKYDLVLIIHRGDCVVALDHPSARNCEQSPHLALSLSVMLLFTVLPCEPMRTLQAFAFRFSTAFCSFSRGPGSHSC